MEKMFSHPLFIYFIGLAFTAGIMVFTNRVHSKNMMGTISEIRGNIRRLFDAQDSLRVGQTANCTNIENLRNKVKDMEDRCYDRHK